MTGQRVVIDQLGSDPLDAIEHHAHLAPMAMPDPAALGPRDVVVEVKSAAVGWVDLIMASGQYQHVPVPPYTPGLELAGAIAWAGAEADVAVGSRVLIDPFVVGPRTSGPYRAWGGFASYAVAPVEAVRAIPGELTFDQAAALHGSYETAYHCLIARGHVAAGETVVILGATGAVGLAAVHVAKLAGATVIAVGRSPEKLAVVQAQGADHVIVLRAAGSDLKAAVKTLTAGRGADVIYDGVGGELSIEAMRAARFGARYLIVGWASTPQARGAPNQLPSNLVMMKGLDVLGCPAVISTQRDPSIRAPRLAQIFAWANAGKLVPYVSHRFPLADFKAALLAKWRGEVIGGCVVNP